MMSERIKVLEHQLAKAQAELGNALRRARASGDEYAKLKAENARLAACAAGPGYTPNASLPPLGDGPKRKMVLRIQVSADFEKRLDNQWMVEREIHADRWSWEWDEEADPHKLAEAKAENARLRDLMMSVASDILAAADSARLDLYIRLAQRLERTAARLRAEREGKV